MHYSGASRRDLLKAVATAGGAMVVPACGLWSQTASNPSGTNPRRIDVHHHYDLPGGRGVLGSWTPTKAIEEMDKHGIETSIISRTSGETEEGGEKGRAFARKSNELDRKSVV